MKTNTMTKREFIKAELESITLRHTATVAGRSVTRWPAGFELDTIDGRTPARTLDQAVALLMTKTTTFRGGSADMGRKVVTFFDRHGTLDAQHILDTDDAKIADAWARTYCKAALGDFFAVGTVTETEEGLPPILTGLT